MTLEDVLLKLETKCGWTNTEYLQVREINLIKDILTICQEVIAQAKIEENEYWIKYSYGLSKFGDTATYADDFNNRIKELSLPTEGQICEKT